MKQTILTFVLTFVLSSFASYMIASEEANLKEFKREVTREFSVSADPNLRIENKYGNIRIIEGTDNKITFKIEITGKGTTEALAKEYAEAVSIDFAHSGNNISATTVLKEIRNCNNCGRTTHYTVVAPKSVMMNLENKYGNIHLENAIKPLKVDLKYGNIEANTLSDINIDLKNGNATINACENIQMDCGYTKIKIGKANRMKAVSKYDDFQIGTVSDVDMDTKYTKVKIDKLNNSFVCNDFKYCSLNISDISTQFSRIKIDAGYSNIQLALDKRHSFKATLSSRYGNIKAGDITFNNVSLGNKARNTEGISGIAGSNSNPSAVVDITASYGDIVFK